MTVHFIVSVNIDDPASREPYDRYIQQVKPIVESYGGTYLVRSENIIPLMGNWQPDRVIIIAFNTLEELNTCFASPEYRAIESLRSDTVTANAIIVQT